MNIIVEGLKDALPIVERFAPTLASVLGGVPGLAATSALSLLGAAFGSDTSDFHKLATTILSDSNVQDKLQNLEKIHSAWLPFSDNLKKLTKAEVHINLEWDNASKGTD
jgi:hypothetical protein